MQYYGAKNILTQTVNGQTTSFEYDVMGRQMKVTAVYGNSVNYTCNADDQLLTRAWARGIVTTYTYDNAMLIFQTFYNKFSATKVLW